MDRREQRVQRHILKRITEALDGRSWNWLAESSGVPQSTLASQSTKPRFSIETLVLVAHTLKKPVSWFFPDAPEAVLDAEAFRRVEAIVEQARAAKHD